MVRFKEIALLVNIEESYYLHSSMVRFKVAQTYLLVDVEVEFTFQYGSI